VALVCIFVSSEGARRFQDPAGRQPGRRILRGISVLGGKDAAKETSAGLDFRALSILNRRALFSELARSM
jgi:hypothetical protein